MSGFLSAQRPPRKNYATAVANPDSATDGPRFCCWTASELPEWMNLPLCAAVPSVTRAVALWVANLVAFLFHTALTVTVLVVSTRLDNWETHGGVLLPCYRSRLMFSFSEEGASTGWDLTPQYVTAEDKRDYINLTAMTILFFALSAFFHLLVVLISYKYTLYYWWLDECRQPLRCAHLSSPRFRSFTSYRLVGAGGLSTRCLQA